MGYNKQWFARIKRETWKNNKWWKNIEDFDIGKEDKIIERLVSKKFDKRYKDLEDFKNDLLKYISIALKQAENGEVISFEDFCKEMSEKYEL